MAQKQANILSTTLQRILNSANNILPVSAICSVSSEKLEKVVKAPRTPIMMAGRHSGAKLPFSTTKTYNKPTKNEPAILTINVA